MNCNPVDLALQHVSETKHLLDALLTSSERFDYPKAKLALKALQKKSRELAKVQVELRAAAVVAAPANVVMLPNGRFIGQTVRAAVALSPNELEVLGARASRPQFSASRRKHPDGARPQCW